MVTALREAFSPLKGMLRQYELIYIVGDERDLFEKGAERPVFPSLRVRLRRGDDGAAFHVVNRLRERLGQRPLPEDDSGLEALTPETAVFLPQLTPELAVDAAPYHRLVLIDAHVTAEVRPVIYLRLQAEYRPPGLSLGNPRSTSQIRSASRSAGKNFERAPGVRSPM